MALSVEEVAMRARRTPEMQDLPALLARVVEIAAEYRADQERAAEDRERLADALAAAHAAGAGYSLLGRLVGWSRQSVQEAVSRRTGK